METLPLKARTPLTARAKAFALSGVGILFLLIAVFSAFATAVNHVPAVTFAEVATPLFLAINGACAFILAYRQSNRAKRTAAGSR